MGISNNDPASEYQLFGVLIHELIEKVAKKEIINADEVKAYISSKLNTLMAIIMKTKFNEEWNITEVTSWVNQFSGEIYTEHELSETIQGIPLKGRADIIFSSNESIEVVDVKSGKLPTAKEIKTYEYIQLGVYLLLIEKAFKKTTLKASLLAKDQHFSTPIDYENEAFSDYMSGLKKHLVKLFNQLSESKFNPADALSDPRFTKNQCRVCEYYYVCHFKDRHQR